MSHLENESQSTYQQKISFSAQELKQLRKRKNLWFAGWLVSLLAWMYIMITVAPQNIILGIASVIMLGPLVLVSLHAAEARREYLPRAEDAAFVKTWLQFFKGWMVSDAANQMGFRTVLMDVSMSSKQPGVLRVEVSHFEPMYMPMVFELGAEFVGGLSGADPKKVFPILHDAVSNAATAGTRATQLENYFSMYTIPVVSADTREAIGLHGDD